MSARSLAEAEAETHLPRTRHLPRLETNDSSGLDPRELHPVVAETFDQLEDRGGTLRIDGVLPAPIYFAKGLGITGAMRKMNVHSFPNVSGRITE